MEDIRPEHDGDEYGIYRVHAASFPTIAEARLVAALRAAGRWRCRWWLQWYDVTERFDQHVAPVGGACRWWQFGARASARRFPGQPSQTRCPDR